MEVLSKNRREKRYRDLVENPRGSEPHSTAISVWEIPDFEYNKQSTVHSLVSTLLKPCCCRSNAGPRDKVEQSSIASTREGSMSQSSSTTLVQADSECASGCLIFVTSADISEESEDSISVNDVGEVSELAENSGMQAPIVDSPLPDPVAVPKEQANIPGVPDNLTTLPPTEAQPSLIQPLYFTNAMNGMNRELQRVEEQEEIPPIVPIRLKKPPALSKKQKLHHDKLLAQLNKQSAKDERQALKAKLVDKHETMKQEAEKITRLKKRAKVNEKHEKLWKEADKQLFMAIQFAEAAEQTMLCKNAAIEKHNAAIALLKREIELLKEKQEYKMVKHELVLQKDPKNILSETVKLCKATKLKHRHFTLSKEISKLWNKVYSRQQAVKKLSSSSSVLGYDIESNSQTLQQASTSNTSTATPPKDTLVRPWIPKGVDKDAGVLRTQRSYENAGEKYPFVRYKLPPVHKMKPENAALLALFIGESERKLQQSEGECLELQESCGQNVTLSTKEMMESETVSNLSSIDSISCDLQPLEQLYSSHSFEFEESPKTDEAAFQNNPQHTRPFALLKPIHRLISPASPYPSLHDH